MKHISISEKVRSKLNEYDTLKLYVDFSKKLQSPETEEAKEIPLIFLQITASLRNFVMEQEQVE